MSILFRGHSFILPKYFNKIAAVIEAAFHTDISNWQPGAMKHLGCFFYAVHVYIVHWSLMCNGTEKTAEIPGVHVGDFCQVVQEYRRGIMKLYIFKNRFNQVNFMGILNAIRLAVGISTLLQDSYEKLADTAKHYKFPRIA